MFENQVVKNELERIKNIDIAETTEDGRCVEVDLNILKSALFKINNDLLSGKNDCVVVELNMWDECHKSFDRILNEFNLDVDDSKSDFDIYQWCIVKKGNIGGKETESYSLEDIAKMCEVAVILSSRNIDHEDLHDFFKDHVKPLYDHWKNMDGNGVFKIKNILEEGCITEYANRVANELYK